MQKRFKKKSIEFSQSSAFKSTPKEIARFFYGKATRYFQQTIKKVNWKLSLENFIYLRQISRVLAPIEHQQRSVHSGLSVKFVLDLSKNPNEHICRSHLVTTQGGILTKSITNCYVFANLKCDLYLYSGVLFLFQFCFWKKIVSFRLPNHPFSFLSFLSSDVNKNSPMSLLVLIQIWSVVFHFLSMNIPFKKGKMEYKKPQHKKILPLGTWVISAFQTQLINMI